MNRRRIVKLTLLAGFTATAAFAAVQAIDRMQPDYVWKSAQAALAAEKTAEAKIYLQSVVQAQPKHGEAHHALAKLLIADAAAAGRPATYADLPPAARHLAEAARYLPKDIELQRQVLKLDLAAGRIDDGYEVARRIQAKDPHDPDMLAAYARHAAKAYIEAEQEINKLLDRSSGYRAKLTRAELDVATKNRSHFQQTVGAATTQALAATADELAALPKVEFDALASLLLVGVLQADDAATAAMRIHETLRVCEKLAGIESDVQAPAAQLAAATWLKNFAVLPQREITAVASGLVGGLPHSAAEPNGSRIERVRLAWNQLARIGARIQARGPNLAAAADLATTVQKLAAQKSSPTKLAERVEAIHQAAIVSGVAGPFALRHAALVALQRGRVDRALERLELGIAAAQKQAEKNEELELRLIAGRILVAARSPAAKAHIDALLAEADPKSVGWGHLLSGRSELLQGQAESALKHLSEARRRIGYPPETREGFIDAYLALGRWEAALDELAGLAAEKPTPTGASAEQAAAAVAARDHYVAVRRLQAYWGQQAWDRAAESIDALAGRQPNAAAIKGVLGGLLHLAAKQPVEAVAVSRTAREAQPQDFSLVINELRVLLAAERGEEAERLAEENTLAQTDVRRLIALAETLAQGGRIEAARRFAEQARAAAKTDEAKLLVHAYQGNVALVRWRHKQDRAALVEAREHYVAMLSVQPQNFIAGNNLAWLLAVDFDEPQEALRIAERVRGDVAVEKLPTVFVDTLAVVYRKAGKPAQAVEVLRPALTREPKRSELHYQLGLALWDDRQEVAGRGELEAALALGLKGEEAIQARQMLQAPAN